MEQQNKKKDTGERIKRLKVKLLMAWARYRPRASRFLHHIVFSYLLPKRLRNATKKQIYTIIFQADTPGGKRFDVWLLIAILANTVLLLIDSLISAPILQFIVVLLEWCFTIAFTVEFYLRLYCLKRPRKYIFSFYGVIDILSIFPAYLSLIFPATRSLTVLRLLRMLRIFRIFHMKKFLQEGHNLMMALRRSITKILIFMLFVYIVAIILGTFIYMFEHNYNENITSIPKGIYWAVVTLTTVGYGDITPVTPMGQFLSIVIMILGYSIIAVPTGIVAGETIAERRHEQEQQVKPSETGAPLGQPTPDKPQQTQETDDNSQWNSWLQQIQGTFNSDDDAADDDANSIH